MNDAHFEALVRRHIGAVGAYARALSRNEHEADEAVQETLVRAWKYLDTFDARGSFEGWLIRICRNCVFDIARRTRWAAGRLLVEPDEPPDHSHELIDFISMLPMHQREVVVICALLGYDYESAAQLLDIPIGTVRSRLFRGRVSIMQMIEDAEEEVTA